MDEIVEGRLVTHMHDAENWRLRDMIKHPRDPNWESGRYSRCHIDFRTNNNLQINTMVFDIVSHNITKDYVVRSAFVIKDIIDGTLFFDSFIFADDEPYVMSITCGRTRYGTKLPTSKTLDLLGKLVKVGYNRYKIGERPKSISIQDWNKMKAKAQTTHIRKHFCN